MVTHSTIFSMSYMVKKPQIACEFNVMNRTLDTAQFPTMAYSWVSVGIPIYPILDCKNLIQAFLS